MSIAIPTTGMEYTIIPDGNVLGVTYPGSDLPYTWSPFNISYAECVPLSGYTIQARYRVVDPELIITYPIWNLVSQTLTCTSHAIVTPGNPFQQDDGLYVATPGVFGPVVPAVAGITDGSCYDYFKIFDESESGYLERLGPYDSTPIENSLIPTTPYDEAQGIYPIDALTKFIPDTRQAVVVTYELTTTYNLGFDDTTDVINISHTVTQSTDDWSAQVKSLRSKSYFYQGARPSKPS